MIKNFARIVSLPAQPPDNVDVTAVGKDPLWKIAGRTALVADAKGKHALKIIEGAGMALLWLEGYDFRQRKHWATREPVEAELLDEVTLEHFLETNG